MSRKKPSTLSRRQRRDAFKRAGYLKIKNMYSPFSGPGKAWYDKMREDGRAMHEAHVKRVMDDVENQLQTKLNSMKEHWAELGYNKEEIQMLEESWSLTVIKDKDTYREDKKKSLELSRKATESKRLRENANN